jgi:hypothetical protein
MQRPKPPLPWATLTPQERAELRHNWRICATTQPDERRAFGMAAALGRYAVARSMRRRQTADAAGSLDPIDRI